MDETKCNGVSGTARDRSVVADPCGDLAVFPTDIARAPVKRQRNVQTSVGACLGTKNRLVCHAIDQVASVSLIARRIRKLARVVGCAKFVNSGISLSRIVRRLVGRRLRVVRKTNLAREHRRVTDGEMQSIRILREWIAISGQNGRLDVDGVPWNYLDQCCGRSRRRERLVSRREQISEGIVEGLDDVGSPVFLVAKKVEAPKLAYPDEEAILQKCLLDPERIHSDSMRVCQSAGISKDSDVRAKILAELPNSSSVERQSVPVLQSTKIYIHRAANATPASLRLPKTSDRICLRVCNVKKVEDDAFCRQFISLSI